MSKSVVARWQNWDARGIEHLVLREGTREIVAESVVVGAADGTPFALRYRIRCDKSWRVRSAEIAMVGDNRKIEIAGDGKGNWSAASGKPIPKLKGAIDIDLSATPFTNTLPIRRFKLQRRPIGRDNHRLHSRARTHASADPQRYTCLEARRRYRYESLDSDFTREIEVDSHGLVVDYPGLFRRLS